MFTKEFTRHSTLRELAEAIRELAEHHFRFSQVAEVVSNACSHIILIERDNLALHAQHERDVAAQAAPKPMDYDFLIWWTSQDDCSRITPLDTWPSYLYRQYVSRVGRAGRGRLWIAEGLNCGGIRNWAVPGNWLCQAAEGCAGIVILGRDRDQVKFIPGFVTTMEMTLPVDTSAEPSRNPVEPDTAVEASEPAAKSPRASGGSPNPSKRHSSDRVKFGKEALHAAIRREGKTED